MNKAIFSTEVFGMIFLAVLMFGSAFETKHRSTKTRMFLFLMISVFCTLLIDSLSYINWGWNMNREVRTFITTLTYIAPFAVYALFLEYIYLHISTKAEVSHRFFEIGIVVCIISALTTLILCERGLLFNFDNDIYHTGRLYNHYLSSYIITLIYTFCLVVIFGKKIGFHDTIAVMMFILIPILFIVINFFNLEMAFSIPSMTISCLINYVMLQAEREQTLLESERASTQRAHFDELTGLQNRLAMNEIMDNLSGKGNIGVAFCDLNGLKYTNDHFGHTAGDDLLCEFAEILLSVFRKSDLFRISGDEFIVLIPGVPMDTFDRKCKDLKRLVKDRKIPIAAVGYTYGGESELKRLLDIAEKEMYKDKKLFYEAFPAYSRKDDKTSE